MTVEDARYHVWLAHCILNQTNPGFLANTADALLRSIDKRIDSPRPPERHPDSITSGFLKRALNRVTPADSGEEMKEAVKDTVKDAVGTISHLEQSREDLLADVRILTTALYNAMGWDGEKERIPEKE